MTLSFQAVLQVSRRSFLIFFLTAQVVRHWSRFAQGGRATACVQNPTGKDPEQLGVASELAML